MSSPPSPSSWYLSHLSSHIDSSRRHLHGEPSSSTFHTPAALFANHTSQLLTPWTPSDKARFFAALSRHSRIRPDLIARDIAKSESDVLAFLDLLEAGSFELERTHGSFRGFRDRGHRWARSHRWRSGLAPAAREVSDRWVAAEEELAQGARKVVEENEEEEVGATRRKTRKNEVREGVKSAAEGEGKRPGRVMSRGLVREGLRERWEVEDWGDSLDREKLVEMDKRLTPAWSGWYAESVKRKRKGSDANGGGGDDGNGNGNNGNGNNVSGDADSLEPIKLKPKRAKPGTRKANLRRDDAFLDELGRIPRDQWTPEQRAVWNVVNNRARMRRFKRKKKLVESGWTEQAIEEQGGVDAVYEGHGAGDAEIAEIAETAETAETAVETIKTENVVSPAPVSELQRYAMEHGLDLFNYDKMVQFQEHLSPSPPHLSFDILSTLRSELLAYLLPLIHHAIIVAEQASLQCSADNTDNADNNDTADDTGEITSEHVYHAMALRGERHPVELSVEAALRVAGVSLDPQSKRAEFPLCAQAPTGVPWEMMHLVHQAGQHSSSSFDDDDDDEDDAASTMSWSDSPESTLTDQEDQQLDAALDHMDGKLDSLLEADLWDGNGNGTVGEVLDERDDPWGARSTQKPLRLASHEREHEHDELAEDADAQEAQHGEEILSNPLMLAYTRLLLDITKSRRRRHGKANRREVYSSYRLSQLGAAMRRGKSEAVIVSDESEGDLSEDDNGEAA